MSLFTEDDRNELGIFLRGPAGQHFLDYLREHEAVMPPHFTPADGVMQQHHISLHHAFGVGEKAKIAQIIKLTEAKKPVHDPEPVQLFDGKQLGR